MTALHNLAALALFAIRAVTVQQLSEANHKEYQHTLLSDNNKEEFYI